MFVPFLTASVLLATTFPTSGSADTYFASDTDPFLGRVVATRPAIHSDIESALRNSHRGDIEGRLARLEEKMHVTFNSLPKNAHARLDSPVARHLLHRHFVREHAWLVTGLAPDGNSLDSISPDEVLRDHVPAGVHELMREHVRSRGLNLHEVAVLAALIENVVHDDAISRLQFAWRFRGVPDQSSISMAAMEGVLDMYMLSYLPDIAFEGKVLGELVQQALDSYPNWKRTRRFVHDLLHTVAGSRERLTFADAEHIVVDISEQYGKWQNGECRDLKKDLLALEGPRQGYVQIRDFYRQAVEGGRWEFSESMPYLRDLGALDESEPGNPSLIVPNYMTSPSQYIAASHFYAVSCLDECEDILGYIERGVSAPEATVDQVMTLIKALPAEDIPNVPPEIFLQRIEEIAAEHDGRIPLHGRLFMQWLHNLFPRQCSYPHVAGTTNPQLPEAFEKETGVSCMETENGMRKFIEKGDSTEVLSGVAATDGLWDPQEQLLVGQPKVKVTETTKHVLGAIFKQIIAPDESAPLLGAVGGAVMVSVVLMLKFMMGSAVAQTAGTPLLAI